MIAFGTVSGGAGAALTGSNFWQGAATGFVVSALNHASHGDDNGYDKNGNKINDNGGDEIDYLYDDLGNITDSKLVQISQSTTSEREFRMYGIKVKPASGALYDPSWDILEFYAGGKVVGTGLNYLGRGLNAVKVPIFKGLGNLINKYAPSLSRGPGLRIGISKSHGREVFRITYGNRTKHFLDVDLGKIPNKKM
jgi:hypothetical protein